MAKNVLSVIYLNELGTIRAASFHTNNVLSVRRIGIVRASYKFLAQGLSSLCATQCSPSSRSLRQHGSGWCSRSRGSRGSSSTGGSSSTSRTGGNGP